MHPLLPTQAILSQHGCRELKRTIAFFGLASIALLLVFLSVAFAGLMAGVLVAKSSVVLAAFLLLVLVPSGMAAKIFRLKSSMCLVSALVFFVSIAFESSLTGRSVEVEVPPPKAFP